MFKKEFFLTILIFVCLELLTVTRTLNQYYLVAGAGLAFTAIWAIASFVKYSKKTVSQYSDVMMRIQFKVRWYQYFFVPIVFYLALAAYVFFVHEDFMRQTIILLGSLSNYVLFVYTKSSYDKVFSVSKVSKVAFDLINVIFFFMVANVLMITGFLTVELTGILLGLVSFTILMANLLLSREFSIAGTFFASILSGLIILLGFALGTQLSSRFAFIMTIGFYLVMSFWHMKMLGERKLSRYLSPVLFALMALILIVGR